MTSVKVTIDASALPKGAKYDDDTINEWIEARLGDTRNLFLRQMSRSSTRTGGREYKRTAGKVTRKTKWHIASGPGEYPKTDGGALAGSINYQVWSDREGGIYTNIEYAKYLTEGTKMGGLARTTGAWRPVGGWRMEPRLMLDNALEEVLNSRPARDKLAAAAKWDWDD